MPSACQNGARTENTEHQPGTRQTRTDQGNRSWLPTMRQPEKRKVGGSTPPLTTSQTCIKRCLTCENSITKFRC